MLKLIQENQLLQRNDFRPHGICDGRFVQIQGSICIRNEGFSAKIPTNLFLSL